MASVPPRRTASNLIDLLHHIIRQPIKSDQYEYQAFIFLYAAHSHGTWTDLKFELLEVLETEDVTVSDSLRYLNNKSAQLSAVIQKAESPRALFKPSFSAYMEAEKSLKATDAMKAMYLHRDSTEVIGKILKCRYAIVQPHSGVQQKKTASFVLSPDMEKCIGKLKPASK